MEAKQLLQNMFGKLEYYMTHVLQAGPIKPPSKGDGSDWVMSDFRSDNAGGINIMWVRTNDKL